MRIELKFGNLVVGATLDESPTARKLAEALPCESTVSTWGEEVYFAVPVSAELDEDARDVVEPGTVCFWIEGSSLAIPYGRTPASVGDESRLVTRVNVLGRIDGDPRELAKVGEGDRVEIREAAD